LHRRESKEFLRNFEAEVDKEEEERKERTLALSKLRFLIKNVLNTFTQFLRRCYITNRTKDRKNCHRFRDELYEDRGNYKNIVK